MASATAVVTANDAEVGHQLAVLAELALEAGRRRRRQPGDEQRQRRAPGSGRWRRGRTERLRQPRRDQRHQCAEDRARQHRHAGHDRGDAVDLGAVTGLDDGDADPQLADADHDVQHDQRRGEHTELLGDDQAGRGRCPRPAGRPGSTTVLTVLQANPRPTRTQVGVPERDAPWSAGAGSITAVIIGQIPRSFQRRLPTSLRARWAAPLTSSGGNHCERPAPSACLARQAVPLRAAGGRRGSPRRRRRPGRPRRPRRGGHGRRPGSPAREPGRPVPARPPCGRGPTGRPAAAGEVRVECSLAVAQVDEGVGVAAAQHAARVHPVDRLRHPPDVGDVGHGGDAQPELEVARVRAARGRSRRRRGAPTCARPPRATRCSCSPCGIAGRSSAGRPRTWSPATARWASARAGRTGRGAAGRRRGPRPGRCSMIVVARAKAPGGHHVVGRHQRHEVAFGPGEAFVVRGDVAPVHGVAPDLDAGVGLGEAGRHRRRVVGRAVVDDEHARRRRRAGRARCRRNGAGTRRSRSRGRSRSPSAGPAAGPRCITPAPRAAASSTSTTWSWSASVSSWNSGRISESRVSRSVTGSGAVRARRRRRARGGRP